MSPKPTRDVKISLEKKRGKKKKSRKKSRKFYIHFNTRLSLSRVEWITSPGWMHETSAQGWCTGKTQRDRVEREVGGGIGMRNTCQSMADSWQCMAKTTTIL